MRNKIVTMHFDVFILKGKYPSFIYRQQNIRAF